MRMKAGKGEERDPKEELMDGIDETLRKLSPDPSPPKEALSGGKIFSLTFGISLLLLILLMIFVLSGTARGGQLFSGQSLPSVTEGSADHSMDNYRPGKENGMRILLLTAAEGEAPAHYWLLRISPVSGEMLVLSFPDSLLSEDGEETLSLRKASESLSSAEAAVKAIFGKENVSRTIRLTRKNAASLVSALGGMDWEFTTRYQSQSLDIPPGRHRLDGETLFDSAARIDLPPQRRKRSVWPGKSSSCCFPRTPTTTRASLWRSVAAWAGRKAPCLPTACSGCIPCTPPERAGPWS